MHSTGKTKPILVVRRDRNKSSNKDRSKLVETTSTKSSINSKSSATSVVTGIENSLVRSNFTHENANEGGEADDKTDDAAGRSKKQGGQNKTVKTIKTKEYLEILKAKSPGLYRKYFGESNTATASPTKKNDRHDSPSPIRKENPKDKQSPVRSKENFTSKPLCNNQTTNKNQLIEKCLGGSLTRVLSGGSESDATPTFQATPAIFRKNKTVVNSQSDDVGEAMNDTMEIETDPEDLDSGDERLNSIEEDSEVENAPEAPKRREKEVDNQDEKSVESFSPIESLPPPRESDLFLGFIKTKKQDMLKDASERGSVLNSESGSSIVASSVVSAYVGSERVEHPESDEARKDEQRSRFGGPSLPTAAPAPPAQNPANNAFKVPALPAKSTVGQGGGKKRKLLPKPSGQDLAEPALDNNNTEQHRQQQAAAQVPTSQHHPAKSSVSAPTLAQTSKVVQPSKKTRHLLKWMPRLRNDKLYVEGDLIELDKPVPKSYEERWLTSKILGRTSPNIVSTRSSDYVLEGPLTPVPGEENKDAPCPIFILQRFAYGFPDDWETLLGHWKLVASEYKKSEQNASMMINSIMASGNMSLMPGSEVNTSLMTTLSLPGNLSHFRNNFKPVANSSVLPTVQETSMLSNSCLVPPPPSAAGTRTQPSPSQPVPRKDKPKDNKKPISLSPAKNLSEIELPSLQFVEPSQPSAAGTATAAAGTATAAAQSHLLNHTAQQQHKPGDGGGEDRGRERRPRSPEVRVNKNSANYELQIRMKKQGDRTTVADLLDRTMSLKDINSLRAKTYDKVTVVNGKKLYSCEFCDYEHHLMSDLKDHMKKHHLATFEECGQGAVGARAKAGRGGASARARSDESLLSCANVTVATQSKRALSDSPRKAKQMSMTNKEAVPSERIKNRQSSKSTSKGRDRARVEPTVSKSPAVIDDRKQRVPRPSKNSSSSETLSTDDDCHHEEANLSKHRKNSKDYHQKQAKSKRGHSSGEEEHLRRRGSSDSKQQARGKGEQRSGDERRRRSARSSDNNQSLDDEPKRPPARNIPEEPELQNDFEVEGEMFHCLFCDQKSFKGKARAKQHMKGKGHLDMRRIKHKVSLNGSVQNNQTAFAHKDTTNHAGNTKDADYNPSQNINRKPGLAEMKKKKGRGRPRKYDSDRTSNNVYDDDKENARKERKKSAKSIARENFDAVDNNMVAEKDDVGVRKVQARTTLQDRKRPHYQQKDSDDDDDSEFDPKTIAPLKRRKKQKIENPLKKLPLTTNNEGNKKQYVNLAEITVNPKTMKARRKNEEIFSKLNEHHEDDIFGGKNRETAARFNLLGNSDESSGSEISVHSARTPIQKYMNQEGVRMEAVDTPKVPTPEVDSPLNRHSSKNNEIYVHKRLQENCGKRQKNEAKKKKKTLMTLAMTTDGMTRNTKQKKIDASCRLIQTIQQNQEKVNKSQQDDSSENEDDWLDEEDEDCDYTTSKLSAQGSLLHSVLSSKLV